MPVEGIKGFLRTLASENIQNAIGIIGWIAVCMPFVEGFGGNPRGRRNQFCSHREPRDQSRMRLMIFSLHFLER